MFITKSMPRIVCEQSERIQLTPTKDGLQVTLLPSDKPISYFQLVWSFTPSTYTKIYCDCWGVADGTLGWFPLQPIHNAQWYFTLWSLDGCFSVGVKTGCNSFCSWKIESDKIMLTCDVRNGGCGVYLTEPLMCCKVISAQSTGDESVQEHTKRFCRMMCDQPKLSPTPIYGFNTWYYTYGMLTRQSVLKDAQLCSLLASGRVKGAPLPYMVIDDGWHDARIQGVYNGGPFFPNKDFADMGDVADDIRARGCNPGIWVRPLMVNPQLCPQLTDDCYSQNQQYSKDGFSKILDPTAKGSKEYIYSLINDLVRQGYGMVKYDFTSPDFMGDDFLKQNLTVDGWHLQDKTKTNAQILRELYQLINDAAEDSLVLSCNTYNHLVAGIHPITRSGCDTSGEHWWLTKRQGINSLVYRLAQNGTFFTTDADCAAFTQKVPTDKNMQFADLIARCNSALFVSVAPNVLSTSEIDQLIGIFRIASSAPQEAVFLDWMEERTPRRFWSDGAEICYDWGNDSIDG